jgi:hypothetical protein
MVLAVAGVSADTAMVMVAAGQLLWPASQHCLCYFGGNTGLPAVPVSDIRKTGTVFFYSFGD